MECNKHLCENKLYSNRDVVLALQKMKKQLLSEGINKFEDDPRYIQIARCKKTSDEIEIQGYYDESRCKREFEKKKKKNPRQAPMPRQAPPAATPSGFQWWEKSNPAAPPRTGPQPVPPKKAKTKKATQSKSKYAPQSGFDWWAKNHPASPPPPQPQQQAPPPPQQAPPPRQASPPQPQQQASPPRPKNRTLKPCPEGKIRNSNNRCINDPALKSARTKKATPPPTKKASPPPPAKKACAENEEINPETGKCRKKCPPGTVRFIGTGRCRKE